MSFASLFRTGDTATPLTDKAQIDALYKRHRLRIMLAITIGYGVVYTCRLALSMVKKPLIDGGIFTPVELGIIGSALFYTYAFGKLTNGFLADHMNLKVFFAFGVLISALLNIGMGFSTILVLSVVLWGLNGWFQGFGAPTGAVALATLVLQQRAGADVRDLEHGPRHRRGAHLCRSRRSRHPVGLARRVLGPGCALHRGRGPALHLYAGPAADHGPPPGGRLEKRPQR